MTPEFIRLTNRGGGGDLFLRRDMVAAVGSFRDATHVTLVNEDIDYEVKETPEQVLRKIEGEKPDEPLTVNDQSGIISAQRRRYAQGHRKDKRKVPAGKGHKPCDILKRLKEKKRGI